jgi:hypothetical protein
MKPFLNIAGLIIIITFTSLKYAYPQEPGSNDQEPLFIIERSRDADYLVYEVGKNSKDRSADSSPIDVYWIKKGDNSRIEPLTRIQNQYGYGIEVLEKSDGTGDEWHFKIAAFPWYTFTLKQNGGKDYHVYIHLTGGEVEVEKLYVNFTNNSFWHPQVSYVILYGHDPHTGAKYTETISPKEINQNAS